MLCSKGMTEPRHQQAIKYFQTLPIDLHTDQSVARHKVDIDAQVDALKAAGIETLIVHTPCWTSPNLVVRGVQRAESTHRHHHQQKPLHAWYRRFPRRSGYARPDRLSPPAGAG